MLPIILSLIASWFLHTSLLESPLNSHVEQGTNIRDKSGVRVLIRRGEWLKNLLLHWIIILFKIQRFHAFLLEKKPTRIVKCIHCKFKYDFCVPYLYVSIFCVYIYMYTLSEFITYVSWNGLKLEWKQGFISHREYSVSEYTVMKSGWSEEVAIKHGFKCDEEVMSFDEIQIMLTKRIVRNIIHTKLTNQTHAYQCFPFGISTTGFQIQLGIWLDKYIWK